MLSSRPPRIRIGIAGLNFGAQIGGQLVAALAGLDAARAAVVRARHGMRTARWSELLADPTIEAVGLFTGPAGRARLIHEALGAGKHVLTTKPFELSVPAAVRVLAEAERRGRVVHLNSPGPGLSPELAQIMEWRERYDLGRIVGIRALVRPGRIHAPRVQRRQFIVLSGDYDWRSFAAAVRSGQPLAARSREAVIAGLRVVAALPQAARTGRLTSLR